MAIHTVILILLVTLGLACAVYSEWLIKLRFSPTQFTIVLRRAPRKDIAIFIVLLLIVFAQQLMRAESPLTGSLLLGVVLLSVWFGWIRQPVALIKAEGIVIKGRFIRWPQISHYQLTKEGVLVLQLPREQVIVSATKLEDLERLYRHIIAQPA